MHCVILVLFLVRYTLPGRSLLESVFYKSMGPLAGKQLLLEYAICTCPKQHTLRDRGERLRDKGETLHLTRTVRLRPVSSGDCNECAASNSPGTKGQFIHPFSPESRKRRQNKG